MEVKGKISTSLLHGIKHMNPGSCRNSYLCQYLAFYDSIR